MIITKQGIDWKGCGREPSLSKPS